MASRILHILCLITIFGIYLERADAVPSSNDFDGDGKSDLIVFRPSNGVTNLANWYVRTSSGSQPGCFVADGSGYRLQYGLITDVPVAGDYDGDGYTDAAVWRPGNLTFYVKFSSWCGEAQVYFGGGGGIISTDRPDSGEVTGDGRSDILFHRQSSGGSPYAGTWFVRDSTTGTITPYPCPNTGFSTIVDFPTVVTSNYFKNPNTANSFDEPTAFIRGIGNSQPIAAWCGIQLEGGPTYSVGSHFFHTVPSTYGYAAGDIPVVGNVGGPANGLADYGRWRNSNGNWSGEINSGGFIPGGSWGISGDIPIGGDFDGDGYADRAVWRPSDGTWYVSISTCPSNGFLTPTGYGGCQRQWGLYGDIPVGYKRGTNP